MSVSTKRKRIIFIISLVLSLACLIFIFSNSLKNGAESNVQSSSVYKLVNSISAALGFRSEIPHKLIRNLAHFVEFSLLGAFTALMSAYLFKVNRSSAHFSVAKKLFPAAALCVLIAIADELLQFGSAGRAPQISDALIDVAGAFFGIFAIWLALILFIGYKRRKDLTKNN